MLASEHQSLEHFTPATVGKVKLYILLLCLCSYLLLARNIVQTHLCHIPLHSNILHRNILHSRHSHSPPGFELQK